MIRTGRPGEGEKITSFAARAFAQDGEAVDLRGLLPKVYAAPEASAAQHLILEEDGAWQGLLLRVRSTLAVGDRTLAVGHIGTVCTAPEHRGGGVMRRLMARALEDLAAEGCDLIALSGQRQRYERYGFVPMGTKMEFIFCAANGKGRALPGDALEPLAGPRLLAAARTLFGKQAVHMARSAEAFEQVLASWGARAFAFLRQGEFAGYGTAFRQEGRLTVSELRLRDPSLLGALCSLLTGQAGGEVKLCLAPGAPEIPAAAALCERYLLGPDHSFRILCFPSVADALLRRRHAACPLPEGALRLSVEGYGGLELFVEGGTAGARSCAAAARGTLTYEQAVHLLFSPCCAARGPLARTNPAAAAWLPLPLSLEQNDCY